MLADAARRHGALFAVNDRADIARAAGADVLHLGQDDLPLAIARDIVGAGPLIGRSTHDADQVAAARDRGRVDYFCVGPVLAHPDQTGPGRSGPGSGARHGATRARTSRGSRSAGSTQQRLPEVIDAGARRVVVVRAITAAEDPGRRRAG